MIKPIVKDHFILSQKSKEASKDDLYIVEIKNKLTINDKLEILYSDKFSVDSFKIEELLDIKTKEKIECINPGIKGQQVILKIPYKIQNNTIIRRKK